MQKFESKLSGTDIHPFAPVGEAMSQVVQRAQQAMLRRRSRRYQVPATEADRRLTRRICGERDND